MTPVLLILLVGGLLAPPPAPAAATALAVSKAGARNVTIDSATLSLADLTLLGDSFLRNGSVGLTRETGVPSSSAGSVLCTRPVAFRVGPPPGNGTTANFSTVASFAARFSFVIADPNAGGAGGDGIAFFVSPDRATLGSTGGYLGLFNASATAGPTRSNASASIVAVEFDTMANPEFSDPSDNHVGLDLGSPASVAAADLAASGIDLRSGNLTTAWIDYRAADRRLEVFLAYAPAGKPQRPVLSVAVDLSSYLTDNEATYYVGFSAATEGSTQTHTVKEWTFRTFGFPSAADGTANNVSEQAAPEGTVTAAAAPPRRRRVGLALGILGPVALAAAFVFFAWVPIKKLVQLLTSSRNDGSGAAFSTDLVKGPRKFSYKELSVATKGFHASRVIGKGAFGTVYKAAMPGGGPTYAVKRSTHAHQSRSEFVAELSVIACLRHKNLVQLEGWCDEKGELLLVYEYMPNGSLDRALYNTAGGALLSWPQRRAVAAGVACVLAYLHRDCERRVIHRDVKTSNVLLDANLSPRLGDFGLARLADHGDEKSPVSTLTAGTMGYLAPEYLQSGKATEQTDVFSYGVVLLEVCCGRRPIDKDESGKNDNVNLVDWAWRLHGEDRLLDAADKRLAGEFDRDEMLRLLLVGLSCANPNCDERPAMRRVVQILNREADPPHVPRKKPLLVFSSSASMKLQEMAFSCGDEVRGGYYAATGGTAATSPKSECADIER